jgi:hypothetical protein
MKDSILCLEQIKAQQLSQEPLPAPELNLVHIARLGEELANKQWQRPELGRSCIPQNRMATDQEPSWLWLLSLPDAPDSRKMAVGGLQIERYAADIPRQCESRKTQEDAPPEFPKKNAILLRNSGPKLTTDQGIFGQGPLMTHHNSGVMFLESTPQSKPLGMNRCKILGVSNLF